MKHRFKGLLAVLLLATLLEPNAVYASEPVSPALGFFADSLTMVKSGTLSAGIRFEPSDFDAALGVKKVSCIIIDSLPSFSQGILTLDGNAVAKNQRIERSQFSSLRFIPSGSVESEAAFGFTGVYSSDGERAVECTLMLLDEENFAPTVSLAGDSSLRLSTVRGITVYGTLSAADPENDRLRYEIVSLPTHGIISLTDSEFGCYRYTPTVGYTGRDSFEYIVYDRYGNRSERARVNLRVERPAVDIVYSDMSEHWAHSAAIRMTGEGIMSGELIDGEPIFSPDEQVTRCEFLVMAMKTLGIAPGAATDIGFTDDSDIPSSCRGYVAAAAERGIISGVASGGGVSFRPNYPVTRAEAAVMLNNMLCGAQPVVKPVFSDTTSIPAWAEDAIYACCNLGVMNGMGDGYISPYTTLTRAQTAQMLCRLLELK